MRWVPFLILAVAIVLMQTTIAPSLRIGSIWPEWPFVLAAHYALWGPWPDVALAGWLLGLLVDLQTAGPDPVGLHAFCYGAAAWAIVRVRQVLFRDHPLTHFVVTFAAMLAIQLLIGVFRWWKFSETSAYESWWLGAVLTALYTAVWAPLVHGGLIRVGRWTGLRAARQF